MGIKNLNNLIAEFTNIDPCNKTELSNFRNKTFAIDANLFIYKFLYSNGNHINGLFFMINKLSKFKINPVFIFDGRPPEEKKHTLDNRKKLKKKIHTQVLTLKANLLLTNDTAKITEVKNKIANLEKRLVYVDNNVIQSSKKILNLMNILYIDAPSEAEQLCSILSRLNIVDGVISDDTDTLACGSKIILRNFNNKQDYVSYYNFTGILYELGLNYDSFLDLCILLGTDYNSKIKNMNYKSAYKLIKTHKNIESISENTNYNIYYDYHNIRGIFKNCDIDESIIQNIKKSKETVFTSCDLIKLVKFLEEKSSITKKTFLFRLNKMYKKNRITTPNKYSCFDSTYKINTSCLTK